MKEALDAVLKKLKTEKKYLLKYGRQENLMTCFFDYGWKAASPRKVTSESIRTTEA